MKKSQLLDSLQPSPTLAIDAKAKKLKAEGVEVLNFAAGEPDFPPPPAVMEAVEKALKEENIHKYAPVAGTLSLRKKTAEHLKQVFGVSYEPQEIVVSCGAKHSLYNAFLALINPGDEVLLPSPYWVTYPEQIRLAGGKIREIPCPSNKEYLLSAQAMKDAWNPRVRGLILNSPSNPTGAVIPKKELEAIAEFVLEKDLWVISDEIYAQLCYEGSAFSFAALSEEIRKRTVMIYGVSKTYAMTGWRIGFAAAPVEIAEAMANFQSQVTSNPTVLAQKAAEAALELPLSVLEPMKAAFRKRRDLLWEGLNQFDGVFCPKPQGAFYVFPEVKGWLNESSTTLSLAEFLLEEARIALTPGEAFGSQKTLRFSYAVSEATIQEALSRLENFFKKKG